MSEDHYAPPPMYEALPVQRPPDIHPLVARRLKEHSEPSWLATFLFTSPDSRVMNDLRGNFGYLNAKSGKRWDLYIAGYRKRLGKLVQVPTEFIQWTDWVNRKHQQAIDGGMSPFIGEPWRYSGTTDLVSVMAYPDGFDWGSLRSVQLLDSNGSYRGHNLNQVVEVMTNWREDAHTGLRDLAPGEVPSGEGVLSLGPALIWLSNSIGSGVSGNAVYDVLKTIAGLK
ncbi:hypothetical protein GCM10012289_63040 [Nonomuraea cavernae]|uniref:Uncharacterized protein n=2 Tax=Nonomuraea cavernae TaxID=2045107 RepID=A0A917ZCM0_9ACTN|nr:hypothetical protein GCM10012289_63040 [Nonomuraea cavernae]